MKKRIMVLVLMFLIQEMALAQFQHAANMLSFSKSKFTMTNFGYDYVQNSDGSYSYNTLINGNFSQTQIGFAKEIILPNFDVEAGFNASLHREIEAFPDMKSASGRGLFFRVSAGPSLGEVVSLWVGGQYESAMFKTYSSGAGLPAGYYEISNTALNPAGDRIMVTYHGGTHLGFNGSLAVMLGESICLRGSYYYNWIKARGIPGNRDWQSLYYKGKHFNPEFSLYFFMGDTDWGFKVTYSMNKRVIDCTKGKNGPDTYVPTITSTNNYLVFSLCMPGFFTSK